MKYNNDIYDNNKNYYYEPYNATHDLMTQKGNV